MKGRDENGKDNTWYLIKGGEPWRGHPTGRKIRLLLNRSEFRNKSRLLQMLYGTAIETILSDDELIRGSNTGSVHTRVKSENRQRWSMNREH